MRIILSWLMLMILSCSVAAAGKPNNPGAKPLDALGKEVAAQLPAKRVICSGAGCLRLLTYLQAQDLITGVDDMEGRRKKFDARPYAIANPQFKPMPIFGEFRGHDNPERILTLEKQPEVILKIKTSSMGYDPKELQEKTGIPVVVVDYGNLGSGRPALYQSLQTMGKVVGKEKRAEEIIAFIDNIIADLDRRTAHIPEEKRPTVFVGGVAFKGPHGLQSTEPGYPPFSFVHAKNMAFDASSAKQLHSTNVSKEQIVAWNPDYLFLDLATLQMGAEAGGLHELKTDPAYQLLSAANNGRVFGVLPYNWYNANYGSILANAYFIGKTIYPECFKDVDPVKKADEIYSFLVGKPVFASMNKAFQDLVFTNIPVK